MCFSLMVRTCLMYTGFKGASFPFSFFKLKKRFGIFHNGLAEPVNNHENFEEAVLANFDGN